MRQRGILTTVCAAALLAIGPIAATAQEIILYNFQGSNSSDGSVPVSNMIFDSAGNLYGTTSSGGAVGAPYDTYGTAFELSPAGGGAWTEKVLYSFGANTGDGIGSESGLVFDANGNLYGTTVLGGANGNGTVYELSPGVGGAWTEKVIYSFGPTGPDGASPKRGSLIFDSKGNLYGTTFLGGPNTVSNGAGVQTAGTVFELSPGTGGVWTEKIIYNFGASETDGANSGAGLVMDAVGNLYGTTTYGGTNNSGTAFELSPGPGGTWTENVIHSFALNGTDGTLPQAGLTFDTQGNLYGTAYGGGSNPYSGGLGTVFELSPMGGGNWSEQVIYSFNAIPGVGEYPFDTVTFDAAGNLYCTASLGLYGFGQVLMLTPGPNGWTESPLYKFSDTPDGWDPYGGVVFDTQGNLFGTTSTGGAESADFGLGGTVFEIPNVVTPNPTFSPAPGAYSGPKMVTISDSTTGTAIYYSINGGPYTKYSAEIEVSESEAIQAVAIAGTLPQSQVATAEYQIGTTAAAPEFWPPEGTYAEAQSVTLTDAAPGATIYYTTNGNPPTTSSTKYTGPITVSSDETIEAFAVAAGFANSPAVSAIYTITPPIIPQENILYSFTGIGGDGSDPVAGMIFDANGNLYGTTNNGGSGTGTVFRMTPGTGGTWTESVLYTFGTNTNDGSNPEAGLVFDPKGNLYGTTYGGGTLDDGTVFELTPTTSGPWKETIIHNFGYITNDGINPQSRLIFDASGNLYGTTRGGGVYSSGGANPGGTVFELTPNGTSTWTENLLHSFNYLNTNDGYYPEAGLVFDSQGNLYGTTSDGGSAQDSQGGGTVFELSPNGTSTWTETILRSFGGCTEFCSDGYLPNSGLAIDAAGNVYGTTSAGGPNGFGADGIAFELSAAGGGAWTEKVLHNFGTYETDGTKPGAGLAFDSDGNLYGTTTAGGADGYGTVFELTPETVGNWTETVLHSFNFNYTDGFAPSASLVLDSIGNLYGTTTSGGTIDQGIVFKVGAVTTSLPQFSPPAGIYTGTQSVAIATATPGSTIYYTTNGDTPTSSSTKYTTKISVSDPQTIKAIAISTGLPQSSVATAVYLFARSAAITSPTPGSALSGSSVTFNWSGGVGVSEYELWVGSTGVGSSNLYYPGLTTGTSQTVTGLPTNAETLYLRLNSKVNGVWQYHDYTYTASGATPAALSTPTPGSTLTSSSVAFAWSGGVGVSEYELWVGSTGAGSSNLFYPGLTMSISETATGLPTNGETLYVRLNSKVNGVWQYHDYTYIAKGGTPATLTSPAPASALTSSSVTFAWDGGVAVSEYELWVGSTGVGSSNLLYPGLTTSTSETVTGLPTNGETLYVRLFSKIDGAWQYHDYTYTAEGATPATLMSPTPGSTLTSSNVTFSWGGGAGVSEYELWVGTTGLGSSNLNYPGLTTSSSETVSNLPTTGGKVYVRLYSKLGGVWQYHDYTYTAE